MEGKDALQMILERNLFYRRQCMLALGTFGLAVLVLITLIILLIFVIRNPVAPLYFATDNVGRLIKVVSVAEPNMSPEEVGKWTANVVEQANSYDYINYRSQLQSVEKYFTKYGWYNFMGALKASNNLDGVIARKLIIQAHVVDAPKLLAHGYLSGAYAWQYQMRLAVLIRLPPYDDDASFTNNYDVTVMIQRLPILQSSDGLGLVQMILTPADAATQNQEIMATGAASG